MPSHKVDIVPACIRDLTFILANLRQDDYEEIACQLDGLPFELLAYGAMVEPQHAYVARLDGQPVAAFGATRQRPTLANAWSWGTPHMGRAVPFIIDSVCEVLIPDLAAAGVLRCEARALATNTMAHKFLLRMGARECAKLDAYGRDGENFILYEWLARDLKDGVPNVHRRHLRKAKTPKARRRTGRPAEG